MHARTIRWIREPYRTKKRHGSPLYTKKLKASLSRKTPTENSDPKNCGYNHPRHEQTFSRSNMQVHDFRPRTNTPIKRIFRKKLEEMGRIY
jgi:hypothetical protein